MANIKDKICIVGAGLAGTTIAMYLEKKGYNNYVVYEKSDKVSSKAYSPIMPVRNANSEWEDRNIEMGLFCASRKSPALFECEEFASISHVDGPKTEKKLKNEDNTEFVVPFKSKLKAELKLRKFFNILKSKYMGFDVSGHKGIADGCYDGLSYTDLRSVNGKNEFLKNLSLPFSEFLLKNHCLELVDFFRETFTALGYGFLDEIPAAYVLKLLNINSLGDFNNPNKLLTWKKGSGAIFENISKKLKHPVILNSEVTKIERKKDAKGLDKVYVYVNNSETGEVFDKVIICTGLDSYLTYSDANEIEQELFSKIEYSKLMSMAVKISEDVVPESSCIYPEHLSKFALGHMLGFYLRFPDATAQPLVTYTLRNYANSEEVSLEKAKENTIADLEKAGYKVEEILELKDYYFLPHVSSASYADGWYDKVEALQGENNTFFASEVMSFTNIEEVAKYSKDLVKKFF